MVIETTTFVTTQDNHQPGSKTGNLTGTYSWLHLYHLTSCQINCWNLCGMDVFMRIFDDLLNAWMTDPFTKVANDHSNKREIALPAAQLSQSSQRAPWQTTGLVTLENGKQWVTKKTHIEIKQKLGDYCCSSDIFGFHL